MASASWWFVGEFALLGALVSVITLLPLPAATQTASALEAGSDLAHAASAGYVGELRATPDGAVLAFSIPAGSTLAIEDAFATQGARGIEATGRPEVPIGARLVAEPGGVARVSLTIGPSATPATGEIVFRFYR